MSRIIKFVSDFVDFKSGDIVEVEDQLACDAIAEGYAVPTIDPVTKAAESPAVAQESPETTVTESAPETVAAETAPQFV